MKKKIIKKKKAVISYSYRKNIKRSSDINKVKPKGASKDLKYYITETTGKWDKSLLNATDLDVLLRLWNTIE